MSKKSLFTSIFIFWSVIVCAQIKTPAQLYPGLFDTVQMARLFPDSKTFADAVPKHPVDSIMASYKSLKLTPGFNLKNFVDENFSVNTTADGPVYHTDTSKSILSHIDTLWSVLQRRADTIKNTSLLPLPNPYIVPGGRFREIYYWDSYFTMLGLEESHRHDLINSMVENFAYLIDTYGHIPNGNRSYYLSRSQPPLFSLMVTLLAAHKGDKVLVKYRPQLLKEYAYWMKTNKPLKAGEVYASVVAMPNGSLLNRYWDYSDAPRDESYREDVLEAKKSSQPATKFYRNIRAAAESGWDFSSRWLADGKTLATIQTTDLIAVDLNCLLYRLEQTIANSYRISKLTDSVAIFNTKAAIRKTAIIKYCWDEKTGAFLDFNWVKGIQSPQVSIATAFPLFFNMATNEQAERVAQLIQQRFMQPGGVSTTLVKTGQQWDRPNGWAPLQYITVAALNNYGQDSLARVIALRWINANVKAYKQSGKLMEKYDIEVTGNEAGGGEYPLQDGFGWTNGVLQKLMSIYHFVPGGKG